MKSYDYINVYSVRYIVPIPNPKDTPFHNPVTDIMIEVYKRDKLIVMESFECLYDEAGNQDTQQESERLIDIMKQHGIPVEEGRVLQNAAVRLAPLNKRDYYSYFNQEYEPPAITPIEEDQALVNR